MMKQTSFESCFNWSRPSA